MEAVRTDPSPPTTETGWLTRERALLLVLIAATVIAFVLCCLLVRPFIPVLAWALALAIVARPLHDFLTAHIRNADLAAGLAVVLVALLLLIPSAFVLHHLAKEAAAGAVRVQSEAADGHWLDRVETTPWVGPAARWLRDNVDIRDAVQQTAAFLSSSVPQAVAGSIWAVVQVLLVLFTLFFFFRDRGQVLRAIRSLMPLSEAETTDVFRRVSDTVHATVYGSLVVALIQGTMGGLMFWWLGMPSPVVWGAIMCLLAVIPNLGTFVVWVPTAIFLAASGEWGRALILGAWGAIAIGLIDNLLYPYLVGQRMRLHTLVVFFAILGGLSLLGASGVVLGPVIVAVTLALVDVWRRRTTGGKAAEVVMPTLLRADGQPAQTAAPSLPRPDLPDSHLG